MNKFICLACKGTGLESFIVNKDEENDIGYIPLYDFEPCLACQGKGYIENETSD